MLKQGIVAVALSIVLLPFHAALGHEDTMLTWMPDGSLQGIPEEYQPAALTIVEPVGTRPSRAVLSIGGLEVVLPDCIAEQLAGASRGQIRVAASWYHQSESLPHYIFVRFPVHPTPRSFDSMSVFVSLKSVDIFKIWKHKTHPDGERLWDEDISTVCNDEGQLQE